jgi:hypothetical protein
VQADAPQSIEQALAESASVQSAPVPTQPARVQPAPVQRAPAQAAPVQQAPVQAAPVQPVPVQQAPVQQAPVQQAPAQAAPVQQAPVQAAPVQPAPAQPVPVQQAAPVQQQAPTQPAPAETDTEPETEDYGSVVRPYTWTGGRTRSSYDLRVETLVSTTRRGRDVAAQTSVEHRTIADLCLQARSVAEVAAHLSVPLGVVRVLLSDMAEAGLLVIHETEVGEDAAAQMLLMERVLSGLRRL